MQYSDRKFKNGRHARVSFAVWLCKWNANVDADHISCEMVRQEAQFFGISGKNVSF